MPRQRSGEGEVGRAIQGTEGLALSDRVVMDRTVTEDRHPLRALWLGCGSCMSLLWRVFPSLQSEHPPTPAAIWVSPESVIAHHS